MEHNTISSEITTASSAKELIFWTFLILGILINLLIYLLFDRLFYCFPGIILSIVAFAFSVDQHKINLGKNTGVVLLNYATKKSRAVFEGSNWKNIFEHEEYKNSLQSTIEAKIEEDFPIKSGGKIKIKVSAVSAIDIAGNEIEKSEKLIRFNRSTNNVKVDELRNLIKSRLRHYFANTNAEEALNASDATLLPRSIFHSYEEEFAMRVFDPLVYDLDYDNGTEKIKQSELRREEMIKNKKALVDAGWSNEDAIMIVPFLDEKLNFKKDFYEFNFKGLKIPEALTEVVSKFLKKGK